jgi:hypothetical protein
MHYIIGEINEFISLLKSIKLIHVHSLCHCKKQCKYLFYVYILRNFYSSVCFVYTIINCNDNLCLSGNI